MYTQSETYTDGTIVLHKIWVYGLDTGFGSITEFIKKFLAFGRHATVYVMYLNGFLNGGVYFLQ